MPKYNKKAKHGEEDNDKSCTRSSDGFIKLRNPYIKGMHRDYLYHFGLNTDSNNLTEMFGDVKFVCMGGTKPRMEIFANYIMAEIGYKLPTGTTLYDITQHSTRYSMYKVGPVLCVSHGMGMASISIVLNEIIKLLYYARIKDPIIFKVGTCGGFGLERGTVVITENVVDGMMNSYYEMPILGKLVRRPAKLDINLVRELQELADSADPYRTISGTTMCTSGFYEEQSRLDGAFCEFTENEKTEYIHKLHEQGVVNIEMQSIPFAAITHHAGIQAAIICVTFIDKLELDEISAAKEVTDKWQMRPKQLIARYIKRYLRNSEIASVEKGHGSVDSPLD